MTNAEKFKEIFGTDVYPKNNPKEASCIFDIRNCIPGNTCEGCPYEDFWTSSLDENEWKDCNDRFRILKNVYSIAYYRGRVEGERKTVEYYNKLESEGKEDE